MGKWLTSVGLDVGTTTTQMILSRLEVENQAGGWAVPQMDIRSREILYKSPVIFTPLKDALVDGEALGRWVLEQYREAGITREQVDTGAVIITGETSRRENARQVVQSLSGFAGDFVVATAGPDLESVLAARGSGAVEQSRSRGNTVLHMDIGGGTSNLALIEDGEILKTGCLNVGGRLLKFDKGGRVTYVSPALSGLTDVKVGDHPGEEQVLSLASVLTEALEMAAGRKPEGPLLEKLTTEGTEVFRCRGKVMLSFSGGVAQCLEEEFPFLTFGDMGPELARCIRESSLWAEPPLPVPQPIRATVIGAGCHATQLSGSTIFCADVTLPLKGLPVIPFSAEEQTASDLAQRIRHRIAACDREDPVLYFPGFSDPGYEKIQALAEAILEGVEDGTAYICLRQDMAKALGQAIRLRSPGKPCLCLDRIAMAPESFLDVGRPVGPAFPVVVKTLTFSTNKECV